MSAWIVIPVRSFGEGKSRLSGVLTPAEREAFNREMFAHVLAVAATVVPPERVIVISRDAARDLVEASGAVFLDEDGHTLNAALTQAAVHARACGATAVLSLSTDLPSLERADVEAMLDAATDAGCVIAPDRWGKGTNALCLSPPAAIPYLYGDHSAAAHQKAAEVAGLRVTFVDRPGLARDIDTVEDYREYARLKT